MDDSLGMGGGHRAASVEEQLDALVYVHAFGQGVDVDRTAKDIGHHEVGAVALNRTAFVDGDDPRTHLLVLNFDGSLGEDLDTNDDGTFDVALPWETIIDDVALRGPGDPCTDEVPCIYSDTIVGPEVVELPDDVFSPAHVYRCDPDLTWTIGAFDPEDLSAVDTPGAMNVSCDFVPPCGAGGTG